MASIILKAIDSVYVKKTTPDRNYATSSTVQLEKDSAVVFQLETLPDEIKYKNFISAYMHIGASHSGNGVSLVFYLWYVTGKNNLSDILWGNVKRETLDGDVAPGATSTQIELRIDETKNVIDKFAVSAAVIDYFSYYVYTEKSSNGPYLEIFYGTADVTATVTGRDFTSGFYNRFAASNPKWRFTQVGESIENLSIASETFYWRKSGASSWNSIKGSGGQCYVPANTFPAGDIEWYAAVTDNLGRVWSSPTYTISTADTAITATPQSPKNGFANEQGPITFTWTNSTTRYNQQSKAELQWSTDNSTWQTLGTVSGDTKNFTAPANTLSGSTIYWRVRAYNADNVAGAWSSSVSFSTQDTAAVGTPVSPGNTVEDGSGPITFTWRHANNTGTGQTKADLQWSSDGSTWQDLATVSGSSKTYTAPANTFPAGTIYWRVRTYNSDGVAGAWSAALTFVSVAAPPKPVVAADGKPFTTITWQSSGQLAYSVTVDGVEYGPRFGTDKSLSLQERLENGTHNATVKVQGVYGLWSEAGNVDFQVSNIPSAEIKLKVRFDHTALLRWSTEGSYSAYQIYRSGKLIGKTAGTSFVDNLAIGSCAYQIIGIMADGNYTESDVIKGAVCLPCTMICDLERGEWQKLELSAKSYPERNFSESQNHSTRHFCGAALPVLELSQHRNKSGSYEVAFRCREEAEAFEDMLGKVVCIKTKPTDMIIGGLLNWQKLQGEFYAAYSFTVSSIYWEDYKDETDS